MFSLCGLLDSNKNLNLTIEQVNDDLINYLNNGRREVPTAEYDQYPIGPKHKHIVLTWADSWGMRIFYETSETNPDTVCSDAQYISNIVGGDKAEIIKNSYQRIRVVFGDDPLKNHTNEIIYVTEFLEEVYQGIVYDPQQQKLW